MPLPGRQPPQPQPRTPTFSSLFRVPTRVMTGKNGKEPRDDLETEYVPKYGLRWAKLKEWLDEHFADSGCTFTKKFDVRKDNYVVYLPRKLTEEEQDEIAMMKEPDKASAKLFLKEGPKAEFDVCFRDYNAATRTFDEVDEGDICNVTEMRRHLGITEINAAKTFKHDPVCRYVLIYSDMNRKPLKITPSMANLLLTFHQVIPSYLDFMSLFGLQYQQRDIRFSGFHAQSTLSVALAKRPAVPQLGRSGHGYQLCYNLKSIFDKGGNGKDRWSVRPAALHHQFDVANGKALWICTEGGKAEGVFHRIQDLTSDLNRMEDWSYGTQEESFRSSLATHLTCCYWSVEEWRTYMGWLEKNVEEETQEAISGDRTRTPGVKRTYYDASNLQLVQSYEDKVNEIILILEGNNDVMKSLSGFYCDLMKSDDFDLVLKKQCAEDVREFSAQIGDMMYDINMQIRRARLLVKMTADRKALVLQHLQGQSTDATLKLAQMSVKEAIIMRIITIVTLIFLPATFVSTFFSTDIVKYQDQDGNASFSNEAMFRWLQVTLPLSAITLGIGYTWYRYQTKKSKQDDLPV
ncbi:hypothetical protein E8E11_000049 [Didymella keratinophila]|nr:hypothetical protein E8E11_000049 [Didymella keratinophila]